MNKLGLGVIGCGNMGASLATSAATLENARVVCVSDVDEAKGKELAGKLSVEYDPDYRHMLRREDVEAVLIASPPFMHPEMAVAAAEAGVHVFSEKPMSPTLEGCDAMVAAAKQHGVKLGIGLVCRYHATHSKVREIALSGEIGKPVCMMVHRIGGGWGGVWVAHWRTKRAQSGGTLMEVNAHEIDFLRFVLGDVRRVYAAGGNYREKGIDYPDVTLVSMTFASGAVGSLHSSHVSAVGGYGGRLDGTEGSVVFPSTWGKDAALTIKRFDGEARTLPIADIKVPSPVAEEIRRFVEAVQKGEAPPVGGAEGRAATEVALAAYRSIETGQAVELPL
ncbi:MAG: Gfo/Idh/MocA family oxidoreductase [Candidatus Latescibacteria bacterium]|nr:Gfo/Idh/MocA family oxidoreductase [Candidatus Latescibacterota bacterium]